MACPAFITGVSGTQGDLKDRHFKNNTGQNVIPALGIKGYATTAFWAQNGLSLPSQAI